MGIDASVLHEAPGEGFQKCPCCIPETGQTTPNPP